jgi:hypothetical protein
MPFDASLPDEIAPGEAAAFRCKYLSSVLARRCRLVYDHPGIHKFELTFKEPPGSASSSLDELCQCGHPRRRHLEPPGAQCVACSGDEERSWRHDFVPAEPEAPTAAQDAAMDELTHLRQEMEASESECLCSSGSPENYEGPQRDCPIHGEPEAPEPYAKEDWICGDCGENVPAGQDWCAAPDCEEVARQRLAKEAQPPRRPPYAVAYATEGGAQYEIALPGDATIRAEGGALIITHASAVLALTQARPMES